MVTVMAFTCISASGCSLLAERVQEELKTHEPVRGTDPDTGLPLYYTIYENGIEKNVKDQIQGTCWAYSASTTMEYTYETVYGEQIEVDALDIVDVVFDSDKEEGFFLPEGVDPLNRGANNYLVRFTYANGVGDYCLVESSNYDEADVLSIKNALLEYGALNIGVNDYGTKYTNAYGTVAYLGNKYCDTTHDCVIVGWDDSFPRDAFCEEATQDGAWLAQNSGSENWGDDGCFWISYDTPFEEISSFVLSDQYSEILSYDCGSYYTLPSYDGMQVANVFDHPGTLAAVGTYTTEDNESLQIDIYSADFEEILYSQSVELEFKGYHVIELDTPLDVTECAIAITYSGGTPVEGRSYTDDNSVYAPISEEGQSFVYVRNEWHDMSDPLTRRLINISGELNNCCIKALYV